jgi:hypothetical protein
MPSGQILPLQLSALQSPISTADNAYKLVQERLEKFAAFTQRARTRQQQQEQVLSKMHVVLDAGLPVLALIGRHLAAAQAPAAEAPAAGFAGSVQVPDSQRDLYVLFFFAAGLMSEVFTTIDKGAWRNDVGDLCFSGPSSAAEVRSTTGQLSKLSMITVMRMLKKFGTLGFWEKFGHTAGSSPDSMGPACLPFKIRWRTYDDAEPGKYCIETKTTVFYNNSLKQTLTQARGVLGVVQLVGNAAAVAAACQGNVRSSKLGRLRALLTPPPAAVCDGKILAAATGLTEAVAQGVNVPAHELQQGPRPHDACPAGVQAPAVKCGLLLRRQPDQQVTQRPLSTSTTHKCWVVAVCKP